MKLHLADLPSFRDLGTFVGRAKRLDPDGAARLVGHGSVLAAYVSPLHGGGLPDVVGLRTFHLAEPSTLDVVVDLAALTDRFARGTDSPQLAVPPAPATGVTWAGVSPPREGWTTVGHVSSAALREVARAGIQEIADGMPDVAGAAAVNRLRAGVWNRPIPDVGDDVPAGVALAAHGLGFLEDGSVEVLQAGPWHRLTTSRGHVLVRRPLLG